MKLSEIHDTILRSREDDLNWQIKKLQESNEAMSMYILDQCDAYDLSCAYCVFENAESDIYGNTCAALNGDCCDEGGLKESFKREHCLPGIVLYYLQKKGDNTDDR